MTASYDKEEDHKEVKRVECDVLWMPYAEPGLEHLHLQQSERGSIVDSVVIGVQRKIPFRIGYMLLIDHAWRVRECSLYLFGKEKQEIKLRADGEGHWTDAAGQPLPEFDGCIDVDIAITPFTNTLPIRRLALSSGQSANLRVVYIAAPDMQVRVMEQRYTCLDAHADGGHYRYESLASGFTRDLPVDDQGLVLDYPDIWKRVEI